MDENDGGPPRNVKVKAAAALAAELRCLARPFSDKELTILVKKFPEVEELRGAFEQFEETCRQELQALLKPEEPEEHEEPEKDEEPEEHEEPEKDEEPEEHEEPEKDEEPEEHEEPEKDEEPEEHEEPEKDEEPEEEPELSEEDLQRVQEIREKFTPQDLLRLQEKYLTESDQQAALLDLVLVLEKKRQKLFRADMCESDPDADDTDDDSDVDEEEDDDDLCEVCNEGDDEERMLLCDQCDRAFHMQCLDPPLAEVPDGDWFCPKCVVKAPDVGTAETEILMKIDKLYKAEEPLLDLKAAALALDKEKREVLEKVKDCQRAWISGNTGDGTGDGVFHDKYWSLFPETKWPQDVRDVVQAREPESNVPFEELRLQLREEYDAVKTKVRALQQQYAGVKNNPWFTNPFEQKRKLWRLYYSLDDATTREKREEEDRQTADARKKEDQEKADARMKEDQEKAELRKKEMLKLEKERKGKEPKKKVPWHICNHDVWCDVCKIPNDWASPVWMLEKKRKQQERKEQQEKKMQKRS